MSFAHVRSTSAAEIRIFPSQTLALPERRRSFRYPFTAQAECILAGNRIPAKIQDIGSGGVFLKTDRIFRLGESIQVLIDWPVLLDRRCPLRLVIFGKVLRSDESGSAVKLVQYEFRIRPKGGLGDFSKGAEQLSA
jgi:PilZ domain